MKTRIVLVAALAFLITAFSAIVTQCYADTTVSTNCSSTRSYYTGRSTNCTTALRTEPRYRDPSRDELRMIAIENEEADERAAKWEAFCKPVGKQDAYGVTRLTYAHKNCDLGRSE